MNNYNFIINYIILIYLLVLWLLGFHLLKFLPFKLFCWVKRLWYPHLWGLDKHFLRSLVRKLFRLNCFSGVFFFFFHRNQFLKIHYTRLSLKKLLIVIWWEVSGILFILFLFFFCCRNFWFIRELYPFLHLLGHFSKSFHIGHLFMLVLLDSFLLFGFLLYRFMTSFTLLLFYIYNFIRRKN